ncbi:MAG: MotA/TolQ/ExbB proton channel family protein [Pirellulaceae bacterium]
MTIHCLFSAQFARRALAGVLILLLCAGTCLAAPARQESSPSATNETQANPPATPAPSQEKLKEKEGMNVLSLLVLGGWFMIPLSLLSLGVFALIIERAINLRRERLLPERFVRRLSQLADIPGGLDPREAYRICQSTPCAAGDVLRSVLLKVGRPHAELEATLHEAAQRKAISYQQLVSWLSLAAAIAPLIGLLGTVWGITESFYDTTQLEVGQNRAEALSHGIYVALVTTICGLVIAIPATIAAHFFENRIVGLMNEVEEMVLNLLPQLERYEGQLRFGVTEGYESGRDDREFDVPGPRSPARAARKQPVE